MVKRYFEDFVPGERLSLGSRHVTRAEMIAFAVDFDPQPFHLDEQAAGDGPISGLIASGWHIAGMFMSTLCRGLLLDSSSMGSPGVKSLKWVHPVRPGDTLSAFSNVVEARPSKSRPEMGIVTFRHEVFNQNDVLVMSIENAILFGRRKGSSP